MGRLVLLVFWVLWLLGLYLFVMLVLQERVGGRRFEYHEHIGRGRKVHVLARVWWLPIFTRHEAWWSQNGSRCWRRAGDGGLAPEWLTGRLEAMWDQAESEQELLDASAGDRTLDHRR